MLGIHFLFNSFSVYSLTKMFDYICLFNHTPVLMFLKSGYEYNENPLKKSEKSMTKYCEFYIGMCFEVYCS